MAKSGFFSIGSYYVLKATLAPMRNTFFYVILILEIVRLKLVWNLAIHQPDTLITILKYLSQWLPFYVGMALQISLAVGLMFGLAKISRSRELDALHALGFSWLQLLTPVISITVIVTLLEFFIIGWLQPLTLYYSKVFAFDIEKSSSLMTDGRDFFIVDGKKTILLDNITRDGKSFSRVFIYEDYPNDKSVTTAGSKGKLIGKGAFANQSYSVNAVDVMEARLQIRSQLRRSYSVTHSFNVKGPLTEISQQPFRKRGSSEYEWTTSEMMFKQSNLSTVIEARKMTAELNYRFAQIIFILLLPFIAVIVIIEPKRNPGPVRFFVGLLIVLGFNQYLSMATSFSRENILPPALALWLPLGALIVVVLAQFWRTTSKPTYQTVR